MPLPTTSTISLSQIRDEFGGSTQTSLSQYYRGGLLVPNNTFNNTIPTTGTISLSQFYGTAAYVGFSTFSESNVGTTFDSFISAGFSINAFGTVTSYNVTNFDFPNETDRGTWYIGGGSTSDFEVRATLFSGNAPDVGSLNTWLNCGTDRSWEFAWSGGGGTNRACSLDIQFRRAGVSSPISSTIRVNLQITVT